MSGTELWIKYSSCAYSWFSIELYAMGDKIDADNFKHARADSSFCYSRNAPRTPNKTGSNPNKTLNFGLNKKSL